MQAKDAVEAFKLCFEETRKVKGLKDYQQYQLALEITKLILKDNNESSHSPKNENVRGADDAGLTKLFQRFNKDYIEKVKGTEVMHAYKEWCRNNEVKTILNDKEFKDAVCAKYDMEWKAKKIKVNGQWETVKGFKSNKSVLPLF